jgi:hypothetical protein
MDIYYPEYPGLPSSIFEFCCNRTSFGGALPSVITVENVVLGLKNVLYNCEFI